jgi:hypothetical protein
LYQIEKCFSIIRVYAAKFGPKFLVRTLFENWEHVDTATRVALWHRVAKSKHILYSYFAENWVLCRGVILYAGLYCIWVKMLFFFSYEYYDFLFWCISILCVVKTYFKTCTFQYSWNILCKNLTITLYMVTPLHLHNYIPTCFSSQETILREYQYILWVGLTKYLSRRIYQIKDQCVVCWIWQCWSLIWYLRLHTYFVDSAYKMFQ